jgi:hypothetical protein
MSGGKSEVARLRQQIEEELEAMQRGFSGYAAGTARHDFIRARMDQLGSHQDELAEYIGDTNAANYVCETYINVMNNDTNKSA